MLSHYYAYEIITLKFNFFVMWMQKTIRSKGIGTISKKFKAPEISDADRAKAATEVQKNNIKASVMDWWKRLQVCT